MAHPKIRLTGIGLVGGFGPSGTSVVAVPFHHYAEAHRNAVYDVASVAKDLERAGLPVPLRHRAALHLAPLMERERCKVWRDALAAAAVKGKQPTSAVVEALAARASASRYRTARRSRPWCRPADHGSWPCSR